MDLSSFSKIAETNNWATILPEISLSILALFLLLIDLMSSDKQKKFVEQIAIAGQAIILMIFCLTASFIDVKVTTDLFGGLIQQSQFSHFGRLFFMVSSILVCFLGSIFFRVNKLPRTEFYHLVIVSTVAFMLLIQSNHFVMLFMALETVSIIFYILVSYRKSSSASLEAGLKSLIMGAFSSTILLFGMAIVYGVAGNPDLIATAKDAMNFQDLSVFVQANTENKLLQVGVLFIVSGLLFKVGAVPFQMWVSDVYQGAPTPVTAYLAVASKAAGFLLLILLVEGPFNSMDGLLVPILSVVAGISILWGNIGALTQPNVKKIMGFSGIANTGYILVGVVALFSIENAAYVIMFYLCTYLLASFAVFGVMSAVATKEDEIQEIYDYEGLLKNEPLLAFILTAGLGSLAGVPPLVGFIGKTLLFILAFKAGLYGLLAVSVVGAVVSVYYYFGWLRYANFKVFKFSDETEKTFSINASALQKISLCGLAVLTIIFGLYQGVFSVFLQGL